MKVEFRVYENPAEGKPVGKVTLRPDTPEDLAEMDDFRKRVGRHGGGDKMEIVFFPKKERPGAAPAAEARPREAAAHG